MRTGKQYLESLRDGRTIFIDGDPVDDVTSHPATAPAARVIAEAYDAYAALETPPGSFVGDDDTRYSGTWRIPRSAEDLGERRKTHEFWAERSYGLMGRTPDHVGSLISAFAGATDVFGRGGARYAENVTRFYERARDEDLYVAYVIVPPQVDRSKPAHEQPEPFLYVGASEERDDGLVLNGAQMIGTAAVIADAILVTYIVPLVPGDESYAISLVVPANAPGLRMHPRRPYADIANSSFDYPLSSNFDEVDALMVFDNVFVPWEDVFAYGDISIIKDQFFATGAHVIANFQSLSRFVVKLRFASGLAVSLTDAHSITGIPPVQAQLGGEIANHAILFDSLVSAAQQSPTFRDKLAIPDRQYIYTGLSRQRRLVVDLMRQMRELAGGAPLCVPWSERTFDVPATAADTERYYQSATATARDRVRLLKLFWDFVGTEFAGRQLQYEMFYSAAQHVADARVFHAFDWDRGRALVADCLERTRAMEAEVPH